MRPPTEPNPVDTVRTATDANARGTASLVKMVTGHAATTAILVLSGILIPRALGAEGYGRYSAIMAVITILMTVSSCGLQSVEVRYVPPLWQARSQQKLVELASSVWTARWILGVLAGVIATVWLFQTEQLNLGLDLCLVLGLFCFLRCAYEATSNLFLPIGHTGKLSGFEFLRTTLTLPLILVIFSRYGLEAVFVGLAALSVLLVGILVPILRVHLPLSFSRFRWTTLRPYLDYSSWAFVGLVAGIVHVHLAVYVVATSVTAQEAGFLAVAMNVFAIARGFFLAARRSLLPLLSEMEAQGDVLRLTQWGELMMRSGAAAFSVAAVCWALVGELLIRWLLTETFLPAYPCVALILVAGLFFCCAASCNGLLFIRNLAGIAAGNLVLHTTIALGSLILVVGHGPTAAALHICAVYTLAAAIFWGSAYLGLARHGDIRLPLRRTLLLTIPTALVWPTVAWDGSAPAKILALLIFVPLYWFLATKLTLLPSNEISKLFKAVKRIAAANTENRHLKGQAKRARD